MLFLPLKIKKKQKLFFFFKFLSPFTFKKNKIKIFFFFFFSLFFQKITLQSLSMQQYKIFFLPKKNFIQTWTKAPIAHKSWSKEQYAFPFILVGMQYSFVMDTIFFKKISQLLVNNNLKMPRTQLPFVFNLLCLLYFFQKQFFFASHLVSPKSVQITIDCEFPFSL